MRPRILRALFEQLRFRPLVPFFLFLFLIRGRTRVPLYLLITREASFRSRLASVGRSLARSEEAFYSCCQRCGRCQSVYKKKKRIAFGTRGIGTTYSVKREEISSALRLYERGGVQNSRSHGEVVSPPRIDAEQHYQRRPGVGSAAPALSRYRYCRAANADETPMFVRSAVFLYV